MKYNPNAFDTEGGMISLQKFQARHPRPKHLPKTIGLTLKTKGEATKFGASPCCFKWSSVFSRGSRIR